MLSHALNNHGTALMFRADDAGIAELVEAADVALAVDDMEDAARAYVNLVWTLLDQYRLDLAEEHLARAMELTERAEFIGFVTYQRMEQARLDLARAHWDDALAVVEELPEAPHARCVALTVAGTARLRRGDEGADAVLDEARRLADELGELQRRGPVAAARAEAALLRGDLAAARAIARREFDEADRRDAPAPCAPSWPTCCSAPATTSRSRRTIDHPFAVQARGDWRRAADLWRAAGCPVPRGRGARREPRRGRPARRARASSTASARCRSRAGSGPTCANAGRGTSHAARRA